MKRLRRWLFNLLAAVSLVLCLIVAIDRSTHARRSYASSLFFNHDVNGEKVADAIHFGTGGGGVSLSFDRRRGTAVKLMPAGFSGESLPFPSFSVRDGPFLARAGFEAFSRSKQRHFDWAYGHYAYVSTSRGVRVPSWFLVILLALPPTLRLAYFVRRRVPSGQCHACGYDLRATPLRCPECGTAPNSA